MFTLITGPPSRPECALADATIEEAGQSPTNIVLREYIPYRLGRLIDMVGSHQARLVKAKRLSIGDVEWRVLALVEDGSPIATRDLINRSILDPVRVSRSLIALEHRGYIQRNPHPYDNRAHIITITDTGSSVSETLGEVCLQLEDELLSDVSSEELTTFLRVLDKLTKSIGEKP